MLEQIIDLSGSFGFAYERSCNFYKDFHTHDRLMLIFPRGSCSMEVRKDREKNPFLIDARHVLTVPKGLQHDDSGISSIYDTMAFYPTANLIKSGAKKLGIKSSQLDWLQTDCIKFRRSVRLQQLAQDYFFERVVSQSATGEELEFLGRRIVEESLKILFEIPMKGAPEDDDGAQSEVTVKALRFIESNLFQPLELELVAKVAAASVSTLLRKFKAEIKQTPYAYIKKRRMEEARRLLEDGSYNVSQVALLVGYENFGAFTDAFRSQYKKPPSAYLPD